MSDSLVFRHTWSQAQRILVSAAALVPLFAPYELLIRPGLSPLSLASLPFTIIAAGATAVSVVLAGAAMLGIDETLDFDCHSRRLIRTGTGAFGIKLRREYSFSDVGVAVREDDDTDTPWIWRVEATIRGRRTPLLVSRHVVEADARTVADRIAAALRAAG